MHWDKNRVIGAHPRQGVSGLISKYFVEYVLNNDFKLTF